MRQICNEENTEKMYTNVKTSKITLRSMPHNHILINIYISKHVKVVCFIKKYYDDLENASLMEH